MTSTWQKVRHGSGAKTGASSPSRVQSAVDKAKADMVKRRKEASKKEQLGKCYCCIPHMNVYCFVIIYTCSHNYLPYILVYKSRNLSQNKILHR